MGHNFHVECHFKFEVEIGVKPWSTPPSTIHQHLQALFTGVEQSSKLVSSLLKIRWAKPLWAFVKVVEGSEQNCYKHVRALYFKKFEQHLVKPSQINLFLHWNATRTTSPDATSARRRTSPYVHAEAGRCPAILAPRPWLLCMTLADRQACATRRARTQWPTTLPSAIGHPPVHAASPMLCLCRDHALTCVRTTFPHDVLTYLSPASLPSHMSTERRRPSLSRRDQASLCLLFEPSNHLSLIPRTHSCPHTHAWPSSAPHCTRFLAAAAALPLSHRRRSSEPLRPSHRHQSTRVS
jgi:hypothetical protein